jgi:hypothetical protein
VTFYKTPDDAPIGTLFLVGFIIVILALLVSFSNADGLLL